MRIDYMNMQHNSNTQNIATPALASPPTQGVGTGSGVNRGREGRAPLLKGALPCLTPPLVTPPHPTPPHPNQGSNHQDTPTSLSSSTSTAWRKLSTINPGPSPSPNPYPYP